MHLPLPDHLDLGRVPEVVVGLRVLQLIAAVEVGTLVLPVVLEGLAGPLVTAVEAGKSEMEV